MARLADLAIHPVGVKLGRQRLGRVLTLASLLHLEDEAADMGLGDRGDRHVVEFGPEPVRVAAEIGVQAPLLAGAALDHIVFLVEHPVSQGRDFRYLGVFALRRLQAVTLVEHAGLFEGQEAQFTEPDAVRTLVAGIARVQRDTPGSVDDGTHAAVGGAGKLDLMKAESFDALGLFQKPGLGEGNHGRVRTLAAADRGHRRTDGNGGMPKVDPQVPANRPARSGQIVEIKPGQVLAGNDLGVRCDFVPPDGGLDANAAFAGTRQTDLLPTLTPQRAKLAGAPEGPGPAQVP